MVLWMLRPHTPGCHKPKLYNPETLIFCIMCAPHYGPWGHGSYDVTCALLADVLTNLCAEC